MSPRGAQPDRQPRQFRTRAGLITPCPKAALPRARDLAAGRTLPERQFTRAIETSRVGPFAALRLNFGSEPDSDFHRSHPSIS